MRQSEPRCSMRSPRGWSGRFPPPEPSGAAKRSKHAFARPCRLLELAAARLVVVWMRDDVQEPVKRPEVPVRGGGLEGGLDPVVARNESRIHAGHVRGALRRVPRVVCEARAPAMQPIRDA